MRYPTPIKEFVPEVVTIGKISNIMLVTKWR